MKPNYFFWGGTSVQLPCATSAAMPMDSQTLLDFDALSFRLIFDQTDPVLVHRFVRQPKT